jgi:hypothetical protein
MPDDRTPILDLVKPEVNGRHTENVWGFDINENFDKIDAWVAEQSGYVDDKVDIAGDTMSGPLRVGQTPNGSVGLVPGSTTDAGHIYWTRPDGTRVGYQGPYPDGHLHIVLDAPGKTLLLNGNPVAVLDSPEFIGDPRAPTPALTDNDTTIANTAFVRAAVYQALSVQATIIAGDQPPADPTDNTLWWETDTGVLFIYFNDGSSKQWVSVAGEPAAAAVWDEISGKPTTFPPDPHAHPISDVTGLQGELDGKAPTVHSHAWTEITSKPATFPPDAHNHTSAQISDFQEAVEDRIGASLVAGANVTVAYDDASGKTMIASTAAGGGGIAEAPNDGQTYGRKSLGWTVLDVSSVDWAEVANKPLTFPPTAHNHAIAEVTGLQTALDGKAPAAHTHTTAQVTGLDTALAGKVAKAGDTMSGDLTIAKVNPSLIIDKTAANQEASIYSRVNGVARWHLLMGNSSVESGSNVGSDFYLRRWNDAGAHLGDVLVINRASGAATFGVGSKVGVADTTPSTAPTTGALTVAGGVGIAKELQVGGLIYGSGDIYAVNRLYARGDGSFFMGAHGSDTHLRTIQMAGGYAFNWSDQSGNLQWYSNGAVGFTAYLGGNFGVAAVLISAGVESSGTIVAKGGILQQYGWSANPEASLHYLNQSGTKYWVNGGTDSLDLQGLKLKINSGVDSTSTTTGALTVVGGLGVNGQIQVGGALTVGGSTASINMFSTGGGSADIHWYVGSSIKWHTRAGGDNNFYFYDADYSHAVYLAQDPVDGWKTVSDGRLKENFREISVRERAKHFRFGAFNQKGNGRPGLGVLAQEFVHAFPEWTDVGDDDPDKIPKVGEGAWGIANAQVGLAAMGYAKEIDSDVDVLKAYIAKLETRIEQLERRT